MKKLGLLSLIPLVISSCGEEMPYKGREYQGYAYTSGGAISWATVTTNDDKEIIDVKLRESLSVVSSEPKLFNAITKEVYDEYILNNSNDILLKLNGSSSGDCMIDFKRDKSYPQISMSGFIVIEAGQTYDSKVINENTCKEINGKWLKEDVTTSAYISHNVEESFLLPTHLDKAPIYSYSKIITKDPTYNKQKLLAPAFLAECLIDDSYNPQFNRKFIFKNETFEGDWYKTYNAEDSPVGEWLNSIKNIQNYFIGNSLAIGKGLAAGEAETANNNVANTTLKHEHDYIKTIRRALFT